MLIKILFNSDAVMPELSIGWGFSCLIDDKILFDTGEKAELLANNLDKLGVDVSRLSDVVISHDHWDHTGGLETILPRKSGLNVYICPGFSAGTKGMICSLNGRLHENNDFFEIHKNIFVTGEIFGEYKGINIAEQALVINSNKGLVIITGCAHPGIVNIVDKISRHFADRPVYAVLGGFHLMQMSQGTIDNIIRKFLDLGIQKVGPTHCTGSEAFNAFKKEYRDNCYPLRVGETLGVS